MNPVFDKFKDAPWLIHTESEPSSYALEVAKAERMWKAKNYPIRPGIEYGDFIDDSTPEGYTRTDITEKGVNLFLYKYKDEAKNRSEKRLIYYLHGGGFVRGNGSYCRQLALLHLQRLGVPSVAMEYTLAPGAKYPVQLDEVFTGFTYLTKTLGYKPSDIILAGDSAGGNLAAALAVRLKRLGIGSPNCLLLNSPMTDCTLSLPSHKYNLGKDIVFPAGVSPAIVAFYVDDKYLKDPEVSPYFGDFTGFPPVYFVADDTEVLCSDSVETAAKMYSQGVKVKAHIFHGLWHVFATDVQKTPESKLVFQEMKEFIEGVAS
ncbi:MAG: alpha/beta hydrolase [Spirochaetaceae bacterium]|jgi:acetyl esterase/lipase|nr:alpha/beta hydrolase [Spirochaetaceae bacterium]